MIKKIILTNLLLTQLVFASGTSKLADFLISTTGVSELVAKTGLAKTEAMQIESYVQSALFAIGSKRGVTKKELLDFLDRVPEVGSDAAARKELKALLDKPEDELKKEDIVHAINNLIYLSNRYGKSVIITCSDCVNEKLAKSGFKFAVEVINKSTTRDLLNNVIPNNPHDLQIYIASRLKRLGFGDYSRVTPSMVGPEEEKSLALFLALAENGSPDYKRFSNVIKKISTKNGNTNLFDPNNSNKLWRVVATDMSAKEMDSWINALGEVAAVAEKEKLSTEEAFYKVLKIRSEGNDVLLQKFKNIKAKRCYFR